MIQGRRPPQTKKKQESADEDDCHIRPATRQENEELVRDRFSGTLPPLAKPCLLLDMARYDGPLQHSPDVDWTGHNAGILLGTDGFSPPALVLERRTGTPKLFHRAASQGWMHWTKRLETGKSRPRSLLVPFPEPPVNVGRHFNQTVQSSW